MNIEGPNQSRRFIDGELISDADRLGHTAKQEDFGFTFGASKRWRETFAEALASKFDAASNVRDMDREGVDISVLFPTLGLYIMWRDNLDPELSAAICRAYNTWLSDYCSYDPKRLHGVALIPLQDPKRAVEELKYAKENSVWWASSGGPINYAAARFRARTICRFMKPPPTWASRFACTKGARTVHAASRARTATANSAATSPAIPSNKCSPV